jgi:hypothetical protein
VTPFTRPGIAHRLTALTSTLPAAGAAPDSPFVLVDEALARGVRFQQGNFATEERRGAEE